MHSLKFSTMHIRSKLRFSLNDFIFLIGKNKHIHKSKLHIRAKKSPISSPRRSGRFERPQSKSVQLNNSLFLLGRNSNDILFKTLSILSKIASFTYLAKFVSQCIFNIVLTCGAKLPLNKSHRVFFKFLAFCSNENFKNCQFTLCCNGSRLL